ncbi:MAG: hypothetical protein JWN84_3363 [Nocardioides sp.]|nr:hypothetical protein [Nocardioides sp.]
MPGPTTRDPSSTRLLRAAVVLAVVPAVVVLLLGILVAARTGDPFGDLTRDLRVTADVPLHFGALSALTVMVWTSAAAVALVTAWPVRRSSRPAALLLALGVLSLALAVDDQFMVHDGVLPAAGLPGEIALAAYAAWAAATGWRHRELLRVRPETPVLLLGGVLLAGSLGVDLVVEKLDLAGRESLRIFVEDGLKLVGAAVWTVGVCALARSVQREAGPSPAPARAADHEGS